MGLKIKDMSQIFGNLVDWITAKTDKITDFNVGSAIRTLLESISVQFEEFYFDMKQNIVYAIENSVYNAFGFELKVSTKATGYVTITFESELPRSLTFPAGTTFCTSSSYGYIYFITTEEYTAPEGSLEVLVPVECKQSGEIGNIPAGAINTIVTTNPIIKEVTNKTAFTNGEEEETSSARKKRFQHYIKTLARGTVDSIVYGALEVEGVSGAWADDNYIGYVKLYVHDSDGNLPEELRTAVLNNMINYRAGGIEVEVLPIIRHPIDTKLDVIIDNDYDTKTYDAIITSLVTSFLNDYSVSDNFYVADLIHAVMSVYDDVIVNIVINQGEDIYIQNNELIRAGNININCINLRDWRS